MSKIDEVRKAMMEALKAGDKPRKEALSLLLSALKAKCIDKRADLTEEEENAVVYKEIKAAQETLDALPADRTALIDECRLRMAIYSEFAPKLMGEDEVRKVVSEVLATAPRTRWAMAPPWPSPRTARTPKSPSAGWTTCATSRRA